MKRALTSVALCVIVTGAMAMPAFLSVFNSKYKVSSSSNLGKAKCAICHSSGKNLNPYGKDVKSALGGSKTMTSAVLTKVEGLDSTHSGVKNVTKIKEDKNPGK